MQAWMVKSEEDLGVARLLIDRERRLLSAGVYHCQQAMEKALKAWLTSRDVIFPKTHDLESLLHLCHPSAPDFARFTEHARMLTPLATEFRYPGDSWSPTLAEAQHALQQAEEVVAHVAQRLKLGGAEA